MALTRIAVICGCLWAVQGQLDASLAGALESDDACGAPGTDSEACQLGMLQRRKAAETDVSEEVDPEEEEVDPDLDAEWKAFVASVPEEGEQDIVVPDDGSDVSLAEAWEGEGAMAGELGANATEGGRGLALPVIWSGRYSVGGIEACRGGNTGYCNSLMYRAHGACPGGSCVQIVNPPGHRTRFPLHIHSYHYNGHGASLKHKLTSRVCGKGGWVRGGFPCGGAARYFGGYPPVFSVAQGAGGISHASITVWPGSCGGGTIVLVGWHCSIEHSISRR